MSGIDLINNEELVALTAPQTVDINAVAGAGDLDAPNILHANKHQINVQGTATVTFRIKGQTVTTTTTGALTDETVIVSLLLVESIVVDAPAVNSVVSVVSYSEG